MKEKEETFITVNDIYEEIMYYLKKISKINKRNLRLNKIVINLCEKFMFIPNDTLNYDSIFELDEYLKEEKKEINYLNNLAKRYLLNKNIDNLLVILTQVRDLFKQQEIRNMIMSEEISKQNKKVYSIKNAR